MKYVIQLAIASVLAISGVVLLFAGMLLPPQGVIDGSVLVAFGEVGTFAGSLFGIDYHYRYSRKRNDKGSGEL